MLADAEEECRALHERVTELEQEAVTEDAAHQRALDDAAAPHIAALAEAGEHLQRYLVRLGLPANPVTLDDPDLWALYETLV